MDKKLDFRIEKTYLFLHNAFTELMNEKRFEDFTVNELCQRAMIRRTTFYKHFADKYEYFTFYVKEIAEGFLTQLPPEATQQDMRTYMMYMGGQLVRYMNQEERLVANVTQSNMFPILQDSLAEVIKQDALQVLRQMESAKHMTEQQREGIAAFYSGGILNTLRLWLNKGEPVDEEQFLQIIQDLGI